METLTECDWWWIDFLECELDASLEKDIELLLEKSQEDRDNFETFRLLRAWVKESDAVNEAEIEERAVRLRAGVMDAIAKEAPVQKKNSKDKWKKWKQDISPAL